MLSCHSPLGNASSGFLLTIFGVLALSRGPWIMNFDSKARQETSLIHEPARWSGHRGRDEGQGARVRRRSSWGLDGAAPPIRIV
jgi:hypothetical protein